MNVIARVRQPDRQIELEWAGDDHQSTVISRTLLEEMVAEINLHRRLESALAKARCDARKA